MELEANNPHAILAVAREQQRRGRPEESHSLLMQLLEHNTEFSPGYLFAAELFEQIGKISEAEIALARSAMFNYFPDPPDPWMDSVIRHSYDMDRLIELARRKVATGRMSEALRILARTEEIFEENEMILRTRGSAYAELGNGREAIKAYTAALHMGGDVIPIYTELVRLYQKSNEYELAIAMAQQGLKRDPDTIELLTLLGELQYERGEREIAESQWRKAMAIDTTYAPAIQNLARSVYEQERITEAIELFEKVRSHSRLNIPSRAILGQHYFENGEFEKAVELLREALEFSPMDPNLKQLLAAALQNLGNRMAEEGRHVEAVEAYNEALDLDSEAVELYGSIALVHARMGDWAAAAANYKLYLDSRPGDLAARLNLGDIYWNLEDFDSAREQWRTARQLGLKLEGTERFIEALDRRLGEPSAAKPQPNQHKE